MYQLDRLWSVFNAVARLIRVVSRHSYNHKLFYVMSYTGSNVPTNFLQTLCHCIQSFTRHNSSITDVALLRPNKNPSTDQHFVQTFRMITSCRVCPPKEKKKRLASLDCRLGIDFLIEQLTIEQLTIDN